MKANKNVKKADYKINGKIGEFKPIDGSIIPDKEEFDNKAYLNNSLKKARAVLRNMVAHAVSNDLDLQSDMILRQEQKILNIVNAIDEQ